MIDLLDYITTEQRHCGIRLKFQKNFHQIAAVMLHKCGIQK